MNEVILWSTASLLIHVEKHLMSEFCLFNQSVEKTA